MSRILRRPMFRGGRVDSRGTGIASGLSYAKGGSVEPQAMYGVGNNANRDAMGREKHTQFKPIEPQSVIDAKKLGILLTPEYLNKKFRKNYYLDDEVEYIPDPASLGMQGMISDTYGLGVEGNPVIDEGGILDITRDQILTGDKGGTGEQYEEFYKKKFIADNYAKEIEKQKKALEATNDPRLVEILTEQLNNNKSTVTGTGTGGDETVDRKKIMEDNKELFAELLGGKKARGEDISNMLLSFAGKALKPEATVKSSFGEFFEEEAKRPSSKTKVDQAAAQLAINQYIKGEISRAELNKLIAMNSMKTNLGDRAYIADQFKTSTSFSNAVKDGIQRNPQRRGQSIRFKEVTSDQMLPENFKPGPEDIGIVFIETDTQTAYEYDNNLQRVEIYSR